MKLSCRGAKALLLKYRNQLGDSLWSMLGLVLMNVVAQIMLYPLFASRLGTATFGEIQYLMAYINIVSVSAGCAANVARITSPAEQRMQNGGDFHLFLLLLAALGVPYIFFISRCGGVQMDLWSWVTYYLLFVAMTFRYYADVAYKLTLNYRRYFLYYLFISVGYGVGIFLFLKTGNWPLAILMGEGAGVLFAFLTSDTLRHRILIPSGALRQSWNAILLLFLAEGVSNLIFNADRLVLKMLVGASAVTVYYLATLVGKTASLVITPFNGVLIGYLARFKGNLSRRAMRYITLCSIFAIFLFTILCTLGGFIILYWRYPIQVDEVGIFMPFGSLAQSIFFVTAMICTVLVRFGPKRYQVIINGLFGAAFVVFGIPATILFGIWGFAVAMIFASMARWLCAIILGYSCVRLGERQESGT